METTNHPTLEGLDPILREKIKKCLVEPHRMKIGFQIGSGNFGKVHVGKLEDENQTSEASVVAIKTIRDLPDEDDTSKVISEFLQEGTMMMDFDHKNIMGLLGVVISDNKPHVLLPLMDKGDLKKYVSNPDMALSLNQLVEFTQQVARGMAYLAGRKFVHRDLAARNCMINSEHIIKIADFGLARDISDNDYYRIVHKHRPLPIRWMALETMETFKFTTQSDVWSFGVLMWEVLTRGKLPYADLSHGELMKHLKQGCRLLKPDLCTVAVYNIMRSCWQPQRSDRPTFHHVQEKLEENVPKVRANDQLEDSNFRAGLVDTSVSSQGEEEENAGEEELDDEQYDYIEVMPRHLTHISYSESLPPISYEDSVPVSYKTLVEESIKMDKDTPTDIDKLVDGYFDLPIPLPLPLPQTTDNESRDKVETVDEDSVPVCFKTMMGESVKMDKEIPTDIDKLIDGYFDLPSTTESKDNEETASRDSRNIDISVDSVLSGLLTKRQDSHSVSEQQNDEHIDTCTKRTEEPDIDNHQSPFYYQLDPNYYTSDDIALDQNLVDMTVCDFIPPPLEGCSPSDRLALQEYVIMEGNSTLTECCSNDGIQEESTPRLDGNIQENAKDLPSGGIRMSDSVENQNCEVSVKPDDIVRLVSADDMPDSIDTYL